MRLRAALMVAVLFVAGCASDGDTDSADTGGEPTATTVSEDADDAAEETGTTTTSNAAAAEGRCALLDTRPLRLVGTFSPAANKNGGTGTAPYEPNSIEITENADGTVTGKWAQLSVTTELTGAVDETRRRITGKTVPSPHTFEDDLGRVVEIRGFTADLDVDACAFVGRFQDPDTGTFGGGVLEVPGNPDFIVRIGGRFELRQP